MNQCNSCGGFKDRGHVCPTLSPSIVEIDGRSYIVPGEVACVFQAVSEERDELLDRLADAQEHDKINIDFIRQYQDEVYELREAVREALRVCTDHWGDLPEEQRDKLRKLVGGEG